MRCLEEAENGMVLARDLGKERNGESVFSGYRVQFEEDEKSFLNGWR